MKHNNRDKTLISNTSISNSIWVTTKVLPRKKFNLENGNLEFNLEKVNLEKLVRNFFTYSLKTGCSSNLISSQTITHSLKTYMPKTHSKLS